MDDMPYKDSKGRIYRYGDFFPGELSMFAYNESAAQDLFTKTEKEIKESGYSFYKKISNTYVPTLNAEDLPDSTPPNTEYLEKEIVGCLNKKQFVYCTGVYRLTKAELEFYKNSDIPLPRYCFNCRHYARFEHVRSFILFNRKCMCDKKNHTHQGQCKNEFETAYSPDRKEMIYCEKCYQQEVY